ncbi:carbon monoxide dehydrogenase subunit G [Paucibacter sp. APW11]|uniref:Carbon monoxide dehydrogenase subunit G n=1 Tax=Roseateles aquae TaxID=3077235 RepID=A0ABU3PIL0_9BURK|nr:carbon monoxide dehydrogenase subunit G [Paucibacter sp. APW11]MDT9002389.1 carbon monoxide dehydrogenase subunit G [Paucibacter sp. APW11]
MNLSGQELLPVSQAQAWAALNDTEMLKAAITGCESLTPVPEQEHAYELLIAVSIGPVKAKFKGRLKLSELNPPESYQLAFEGQGGAAGHGKGSAQVRLEPKGPASTLLHYEVQASVGGKIAQIGSRLVDMAAQKMAGDFFAAFNAGLAAKYPVAAAEVANDADQHPDSAAGKGRFQRLLDWYLGWLGSVFKAKG